MTIRQAPRSITGSSSSLPSHTACMGGVSSWLPASQRVGAPIGGAPTAHDRVLATRYGVHACDMVAKGEFGKMAALHGNEIVSVDLAEATRELKKVPQEFFQVAQVFFG